MNIKKRLTALTLMGALGIVLISASCSKQKRIEQVSAQGEGEMMTEQIADHRVIAFNTIEGEEISLAKYSGQVVLIVNVASECGLTPQYEGLQALYEKYKDQGLTVVGFPANNFGGQEPGSDAEIQKFCESEFNVTFPMMAKVSVEGDDQHPLFAYLTENADPSGEIPWNFHKFLLDKEGNILGRFEPGVEPLADELTAKIEAAL